MYTLAQGDKTMAKLFDGIIPESKAHIDMTKFTLLDSKIEDLMRDCGMCRGIFWSLLDKSSDVLGWLPADARNAGLAALDPLERGYCVGVYQTTLPDWPNRIFTYITAWKDGQSYLYESPSGDSVPIALIIKKLAAQQKFWSWRSSWAKAHMVIAALYALLGMIFMLFDTSAIPISPLLVKIATGLVFFVAAPAAILLLPPRWHNAAVAKTKAEADQLQLPMLAPA